MSGFFTMRRLLAGAILMSCAATGTLLLGQATTGPATTAPTTQPPAYDPNAPIAEVNGRAINNALFYELLMHVAGMRVFGQVFDLSVVQQDCIQSGIALQGAAFEKRMTDELENTLNAIQITAEPGKTVTREDRVKALDEVLRQRGVTGVEFRMGLETRAGLRALAQGRWEAATDKEIEEAWDAEYGEKRTVLLFAAADTKQQADLRKAIEVDKKKPEDAATELKIGVQSVTISKNAKGIDKLRDTIYALRKDQLSTATTVPGANNADQTVLALLQTIEPDRKAANTLSAKKDEMKKRVEEFKQSTWMNAHLQRLKQNANVKINNRVLSEQFQAIDAAMRAQATQPAAGGVGPAGVSPATGPSVLPVAPATGPAAPRGGTTLPGVPGTLPPAGGGRN